MLWICFCGAGGASLGLKQAGFYVIGVDIKKPSNYLGNKFIQGDIHNLPIDLSEADFVWASPPCQAFSPSSARWRGKIEYPNLIPITRELLKDHPWTCIENVPQAPIRQDLLLWGQQFGLIKTDNLDGLWRKRAFELSFFAWNLPKPVMNRSGCYASIVGSMGCSSTFYRRKAQGKRGSLSTKEGLKIMGYPAETKVTRKELVESVPPAYAYYIATEVISRMRKTGYIGVHEQKAKSKYKEALQLVETETEVPF